MSSPTTVRPYVYACLLSLSLLAGVQFSSQKLAKDSRCHMLRNADCDVSLYKILDYEEAGWFYHAPFKSCRPFYAANRERCQQNRDLPLTKEQCEEVCGERCKLPGGKTGICMMEGSCDIEMPATWNPRPCHAYNVQCCPATGVDKNLL